LPADVTRSEWKCSIESGAVRLGLCYVKGLRQAAAEAIVAARPFASIDDLARRVTGLRKDELTRLAEVGALNTLERSHRRDALWMVARAARPVGPLLAEAPGSDAASPLRPMDPFERLDTDYTATGVNLGRHPTAFCRAEMDRRRVTPAARLARLRNGLLVRVAGCVIVRQRPGTANGFLFLSLEDETGIANVIVEPAIYDANRRLFRDHPFLLIEGVLQNQDGVTSVRAGRIEPLSVLAAAGVSHDFR
jgi:error-prone DNA polymerase